MQTKTFQKQVYLWKYGNMVSIDVAIPLSDFAAIRERDQIDDIYVSQLVQGVQHSIDQIESSLIPTMFLRGQNFIITNFLPRYAYGMYDHVMDEILVEPDTISNIRQVSSSFLVGHELGHKIDKYRNTRDTYREMARIFSIPMGEVDILRETYADICGNIVAGTNRYHMLDENVDREKNDYAKRIVLTSMYR